MIFKRWWDLTSQDTKRVFPVLDRNVSTEYLIIGGGFAGLHAALYLVEKGKKVTLIEKDECGSKASGGNSAFLMPDSEMELNQFIRWHGLEKAKQLWKLPESGIDLIVNTIDKYNLKVDLEKQDACFVGLEKNGREEVIKEAKARKNSRMPFNLYLGKELGKVLGGEGYNSALVYGGTYAFHPLKYINALKELLSKKGVLIFENSKVTSISGNKAFCTQGSVTFDKCLACLGYGSGLREISKHAYHTQSYIAVSEVLSSKQIKKIFPKKKMMVWDTKIDYTYYRMTKDNRLLLGGGIGIEAYSPFHVNFPIFINKVISEFKKRYDMDLKFPYYWSCFIPASKDIVPVIGKLSGSVSYLVGCQGIPWAAACGEILAKKAESDYVSPYDKYISSKRKFFVPWSPKYSWFKAAVFPINHFYSKYYQKD